jgi:DNA-3-methyladenine glycosylase
MSRSAPSRLRGEHKPLPRSFFDRDPRRVARDLLGTILVRRDGRSLLAGRIVETEAYLGFNDPAAHAAAGRTSRNLVLWGPPGRAYVYFIYGNHYCLNVSCLPEGKAGCVLIRALEPVEGLARMAHNRGLDLAALRSPAQLRLLTSGPGRLCEAFSITRTRDNDTDVTNRDSRLFIAAPNLGDDLSRPRILATPRIGLTKAAAEKLRYIIKDNPFVSGPRL